MGMGLRISGTLPQAAPLSTGDQNPWLKQGAKFCHMSQALQSRQATDLGLWLLVEQNTVLSREEKRLLQHIC